MDTVVVNVRRKEDRGTLEADLRVARVIAQLLDAQFSIAGIRFGLDPIIGLVPGIGDAITGLAGCYLIYVARKHRLGKALQGRMAMNLAADWLVGLIPLIGDAADIAFKANMMNLELLEQAAEKRRAHA